MTPWPSSEFLFENVYVVLVLPSVECERINAGVAGVDEPAESPRSEGPAQALKTASRIDGVNNDKVRCESVSAAKRRRFFCENNEWISEPPSKVNDDISLASTTFPLESTASCGGLAKGSTATSSGFAAATAFS